MAWIPLESNPEVMNKYLVSLGVPSKVQTVDVYGLDPEMLAMVPKPVLSVLLLFPCDDKYEEHKNKQEEEIKGKGQEISPNVFFLKQVVHNACGTIALIHSIANVDNIEIGDGYLKQFLEDSKSLSPEERGDLLQKAEGMINVHKEIAAEGQTAPPADHVPVPYHFVALVEKDGHLYELDGRKAFPINHGVTSPDTFLEDAAVVCHQYMTRDPDNVNFTIIAVTAE